MKSKIIPLLFALLAAAGIAFAQEVKLTVDPDTVVHDIDEKVYGHFFEHIYHSANGGLWGELLWNRSFEDNDFGSWKRLENTIVQESLDVDRRFAFGDDAWDDYEFSLEAKKTGGEEGFLIIFRMKNDNEFYWANLGGWGNKRHAIERGNAAGERRIFGSAKDGMIEKDRWYSIKVRCEKAKLQVFLDGEQVASFDDDSPHLAGKIGIGTWATKAEFRNFSVKSLDGKELYSGVPELGKDRKTAKFWSAEGKSDLSLEKGAALNGDFCQKIVLADSGNNQRGEISQSGLALRKGETCLVSYWAKDISNRKNLDRPVRTECSLLGDEFDNTVMSRRTLNSDWTEFRFLLTPKNDTDTGKLRIAFTCGSGEPRSVCIDQISLMPKSWKEKHGGFRPDLLQKLSALNPPTIRWPGGCFASAYRWKSGIGPQHKRISYPISIWDDKDVNSLGTDEFVDLCRRVGAEPIIVVNGGTDVWNKNRDPELANVDWAREAADWVEYCNGPADSKWGKIRAKNGHPKPYNVKYWEIDNETQNNNVEGYIAMVRKIVPEMKKIDPKIKIAVAGSHYGPRLAWDRPIIEQTGEMIDYISFHQYDDPNKYADGFKEIEKYFKELKKVIAESPNPKIAVFDSEWNAQSTDWRTGLYAGGILNMFERNGDVLKIAGPALLMRHVSATAWDNAFINFDNARSFPAPNYVVMKLWRDHYAPHLVLMSGEPQGIDAVATKSSDGGKIIVKAVNPGTEEKEIVLEIKGDALKSAVFQLIAPGDLKARNTLESPDKIAAKTAEIKLEAQNVRFRMPPLSAGVIEIAR